MIRLVNQVARRLCAATIAVAFASPAATAQQRLWIFDNTHANVTLSGAWTPSAAGSDYLGVNYLHDAGQDKTKSVRYALELPASGRYAVFLRRIAGADHSSATPVDVIHANGATSTTVDQRGYGGAWAPLGTYTLPARGAAVVVRNAGTVGRVVADAVLVVSVTLPYAAAPQCPTHDDRMAHGLWDSFRGCHYDHTHNSDPNDPAAVTIFGPAGAYLQGKTISYPWQTHNHAGVAENVAKHNGYKWFVDLNLPPLYLKLNWLNAPAPNAVKAIRTQYHFLSSNADARVRLHSFWAEMQICPSNAMTACGIVRGGGLWDTGILHAPYKERWVPVPGQDPPDLVGKIFRPGVDDPTKVFASIDPYRGHSDTCQSFGVYSNTVVPTLDNSVLWTSAPGLFGYNKHMGVFMKVMDAANCLDPTDINKDVPVCADGRCRFNGSEHVPFTYWAFVDPALDGSPRDLDRTRNGRVSFRGFTDETGAISATCTAPAARCAPYSLENAPVGWAAWETPSNSGRWPERYKDFDVSPVGRWWIKLPN